jgi:hypothetical protein
MKTSAHRDDGGAQDEEGRRLVLDPVSLVVGALSHPRPEDPARRDEARRKGQHVEVARAEQRLERVAPRQDIRDETVGDHLEFARERPHGLPLEQPERQPAKDQHSRQGHDERRDLPVGDPVALRAADHRADNDACDHRDSDRHLPVHDHHGRQRPNEAHHRAHRQVDIAGDDDDQHAQRHDDDVAVLQQQVGEVDRLEQRTVRHDLEERHDRDQREQQTVFAQVRLEIGYPARRRRALGCDFDASKTCRRPLYSFTMSDMMRS